MRIVNIDDDQISNFLTERAMEEVGAPMEIKSFLSAEDALAFLKQSCTTSLPDIIFLDLNMPMMSGWELLDELEPYKENLLGKCHIYILTSSLDLSDTERSKAYELVTGFIHKPLKNEDVRVILEEIEEKR